MKKRLRIGLISFVVILWPGLLLYAANPVVASLGSTAAAPAMDGVETAGEWSGASPAINVASTSPLHGSLRMLHRADGLYFIAIIADSTNNNNDQFDLRFDIDHSRGATPDADDFGVVIRRGGTANWGPANADPATWVAVPAANFGVTSTSTQWVVEFHLPLGAPSGLSIPASSTCLPSKASCIGFYFNFFDQDNAFGTPTAKYAQFPTPAGDTLIDGDPSQWADLLFDPATSFPDLQVLDVRTTNADPYKINYAGVNSFEVQISNPGGTVFPDANNVRINLYMSALGIGEPAHRLDTNGVLTLDCNAGGTWPSLVLPDKTDVCNGAGAGAAPLADIESKTINDIVANTAKYTIQNGLLMEREGGSDNLTINHNAAPQTFSVINWNTTPAQDDRFKPVTIGPNTYDRSHECVQAEVLFPNDPNNNNNRVQRNLNFTGVPGSLMKRMFFSLGPFGFGKYDPNVGKKMFLQVSRQNMDQSFQFKLEGLQQLANDTYVAELKGTQSLSVVADITAPAAGSLGKTINENLMVPPRAGEELGEKHHWWCPFHRASDNPVNVNVSPGSVLWIVNYALDDKDVQTVDVDGSGPLPPAGPVGLPHSAAPGRGPLLVPSARIGELVLSFNDFKTGVGIGNGVEVRVPAGATHLSLAINDAHKGYHGHNGTGFRVKIIERTSASTSAQRPETNAARVPGNSFLSAPSDQQTSRTPGAVAEGAHLIPIDNLLPQVCVNGYEDSGQKRPIAGKPTEMYRYIGNVCFVIQAIIPEQRGKGDQVVR